MKKNIDLTILENMLVRILFILLFALNVSLNECQKKVKQGKMLRYFPAHESSQFTFLHLLDNDDLVSSSNDGTIKIWKNSYNGTLKWSEKFYALHDILPTTEDFVAVFYLQTYRYRMYYYDRGTFELKERPSLFNHPDKPYSVLPLSNGSYAFGTANEFIIKNEKNEVVNSYWSWSWPGYSLAELRSGEIVMGVTGRILMLDKNGEKTYVDGHVGDVWKLAVLPNGYLASASRISRNEVKIWALNSVTQELLKTFSYSEKYLTCSLTATVNLSSFKAPTFT